MDISTLTTAIPQSRSTSLCDDCSGTGLINAPHMDFCGNALHTFELRQVQFASGDLDGRFCPCGAGTNMHNYLQHNATIPDEAEYQRKFIARAQQLAAKRRRSRLFADADIPPRYREYTLQSYLEIAGQDPGKAAAIKAVRAHMAGEGQKPGLMLVGPTRMGKTGLLSPLFQHKLAQEFSGVWLSYASLKAAYKAFREGYVEERVTLMEILDMVFIDDLGDTYSTRATDYIADCMWRLINHRHSHMLPMYITSNLTLKRLAEHYSPELARRLDDMCDVVTVGGKRLA